MVDVKYYTRIKIIVTRPTIPSIGTCDFRTFSSFENRHLAHMWIEYILKY